jgi:NADP-dependent aldehyde dehydrogenase
MPDALPVLIDGQWQQAAAAGTFDAYDPQTGTPTGETYPVSSQADVAAALKAGCAAAAEISQRLAVIPEFLDAFASGIETRGEAIVAMAHRETGFPLSPRLRDVELPRTTDQLRQAAAAARFGSWRLPTIDTVNGIRSSYRALGGPVAVFGPNNFPLAFNSISGGDFAAAVAAGNPVIAKANSSHPGTTRLLAEVALDAAKETGMPAAAVQLIYRTEHSVGEWLVAHPALAATGYTGSRAAGLALKRAADAAGKPIYLELSSINPVVILPGALDERGAAIVEEFTTSCLMGTGQFCTNPGLILLLAGAETDQFLQAATAKFQAATVGTLLSRGVQEGMERSIQLLCDAGATLVVGGAVEKGSGYRFQNSLLRVSGEEFLRQPQRLQEEAFGNASLFVLAADLNEGVAVAEQFEGNLTGCIYSHSGTADDEGYRRLEPLLRNRVGRLLNDKMPTGVAVSPAMNHGGPYPATGHPGFTAVGLPAAMRRFAMLQCYDNVREHRLPVELRDVNPSDGPWRWVDGVCTQESV